MSLIRQQKGWSFLAGLGAGGASYVYLQKLIWQGTAVAADRSPNPPAPALPLAPAEPLFGATERAYVADKWNQAVDAVFTPVVHWLCKRGL